MSNKTIGVESIRTWATEPQRRVFISYSHQDKALAEALAEVLGKQQCRAEPIWDYRFNYGLPFGSQIKVNIVHAHVFMPIITEHSSQRGWVHQEIGYAIAHDIPVLPIAHGQQLPKEMLHELHAIVLKGKPQDLKKQLAKKLNGKVLDTLLMDYDDLTDVRFSIAPQQEDRTIQMVMLAKQARKYLPRKLPLRQKGALTSLHIPPQLPFAAIWDERYGKMKHSKGMFHRRWQRQERLVLDYHAREAGFKLIVHPDIKYPQYGNQARKVRFQLLIDYLHEILEYREKNGLPADHYQVAFGSVENPEANVTILGDWFYAIAVKFSMGEGLEQTVFTSHAPTIQAKIEKFDSEFAYLLRKRQWAPEGSLNKAINSLKWRLRSMP